MLLLQNKRSDGIMEQSQDTGLSQEVYLERLLQGQHQKYGQKIQEQLSGSRNGSENTNNDPVMTSFSSGNNGANPSPGVAISNGIQQQQNHMLSFLQGRQQQQHLMTGGITGAPSDLSSNLGIPGLSSNVGLDSRIAGNGIGSGISTNAWLNGLNRGALGTGTIPSPAASLYPSEQDLLLSAQRYPLVGNSIGSNRLMNEANTSISENPLASLIGGLPQFCMPQSLTSLSTAQNSNQSSLTDLILAKQAQAALLQAAQARLPRTIRLPCGARGMKADHNSSTAFFDVPENARHGQHLLCSHSVCRAAGVKFRYCFYCKKPVTKQNFRSRHLHADLDPNSKKKDEKEETRKKRKTNTEKTTGEISKENSAENLKKLGTASDEDSMKSLAAPPEIGGKKERHVDGADKLERPSKKSKLSILDGDKEYIMRDRWEELLEERPSNDLEEIHLWIRKILSVSNPGLDSSIFGSIDARKLQKQLQQRSQLDELPKERLSGHWNSLLDQRPNGDSNGSNITDWLTQALKLLNKYKK